MQSIAEVSAKGDAIDYTPPARDASQEGNLAAGSFAGALRSK
jgi:hypothetical protein